MPRKRTEIYHCINISLLNSKDNEASVYSDIIYKLRELEAVKVYGNDCIKIRTVSPIKIKEKDFLRGKITKYTKLESEQWFDEDKNEGTTVNVPDGVHPNMIETDYYFWPEKHKLYIKRNNESGSPTFNQVARYLEIIIAKAFKGDYNITIVQSKDSIELIIDAKEIYTLDFELSYTNSDTDSEAEEMMDGYYKSANITEIKSTLRSTSDNKINGESDFIVGNLRLARKTGNAKARVESKDGTKMKVNTKNHPAIGKAKETDDEPFLTTLYNIFINLI